MDGQTDIFLQSASSLKHDFEKWRIMKGTHQRTCPLNVKYGIHIFEKRWRLVQKIMKKVNGEAGIHLIRLQPPSCNQWNAIARTNRLHHEIGTAIIYDGAVVCLASDPLRYIHSVHIISWNVSFKCSTFVKKVVFFPTSQLNTSWDAFEINKLL